VKTPLAAVEVLEWNWEDAEKEFRHALEINPNDAQAHQWYGNIYLGPLGRHSAAIAELKRALELNPLSLPVNTDLGYAYYLAGQPAQALAQYQKVLAMNKAFLPLHYDLGLYYHQQGLIDMEDQEWLADARLSGREVAAKAIERLSGKEHCRDLMERMVETKGLLDDPSNNLVGGDYSSAVAYANLGEKDLALAALERAYARREPGLIYLKADPGWALLRGNPQYEDLLKRIGLQ
jgi:tetratricopeptide (TPR) repeat protein